VERKYLAAKCSSRVRNVMLDDAES
jgi:hypothetical protein